MISFNTSCTQKFIYLGYVESAYPISTNTCTQVIYVGDT